MSIKCTSISREKYNISKTQMENLESCVKNKLKTSSKDSIQIISCKDRTDIAVIRYIAFDELHMGSIHTMGKDVVRRLNNIRQNTPANLHESIASEIRGCVKGEAEENVLFMLEVTQDNLGDSECVENVLCKLKDMVEEAGGTLVFVVKNLSGNLRQKLYLDYGWNSVNVAFDYNTYIFLEYERVFKSKPSEGLVEVIEKAVKKSTELTIDAINRMVFGLYSSCADIGLCMPEVADAKRLLMLKDEKTSQEMLDELVGMECGKDKLLRALKAYAVSRKLAGCDKPIGLRIALAGPAGTGKSTLAEIIATFLREEGLLDDGSAYEIKNARSLIGSCIGASEENLARLVDEHEFIALDEIGGLCPGSDDRTDLFTSGVNKSLVSYMESEHTREKHFVFIGYPEEVKAYIETDQGLSSRIKDIIQLDRYTDDELVEIAMGKLIDKNTHCEDEQLMRTELKCFIGKLDIEDKNGRVMRKIAETIKKNASIKYYDGVESLDNGVVVSCNDEKLAFDEFFETKKLDIAPKRNIGFTHTTGKATN